MSTTESQPMMRCGHAANAVKDGLPVCVICYGIVAGADEIDTNPPDLTGRVARCTSCGRTAPSSTALAFFEHRPTSDLDSFYDGCRGWD